MSCPNCSNPCFCSLLSRDACLTKSLFENPIWGKESFCSLLSRDACLTPQLAICSATTASKFLFPPKSGRLPNSMGTDCPMLIIQVSVPS